MYVQMVCGQGITELQVEEFQRLYADEILPVVQQEAGFQSAQLLVEAGGNMVIAMTTWGTERDSNEYYRGRNYREFVNRTESLIYGRLFVQTFKCVGGVE